MGSCHYRGNVILLEDRYYRGSRYYRGVITIGGVVTIGGSYYRTFVNVGGSLISHSGFVTIASWVGTIGGSLLSGGRYFRGIFTIGESLFSEFYDI